jgi:hypothetical protein
MKGDQRFAFKKGYNRIAAGDQLLFRKELMERMGIRGIVSFYVRMRGEIIPRVTEVEIIEELFAKYGVKKSEIWGLA